MAHKTFGFTVDFNNRKRLAVANVKQNDSAVFNILLVEDGKPVDLTNQQIRLFINKPDNKLVVQDDNITVVDAKRGSIRINVKNSAFQAVGTAVAELDIWGTNQENASSQNFFIEIDEQLGSNDAVKSYVDVNLFRQLTEYIDTANANIAKYRAVMEAFTKAGISAQGLLDIKAYIDNNLAGLKAQGDRADNLISRLDTKNSIADTLIKTLNNTISYGENKKQELINTTKQAEAKKQELINTTNQAEAKKQDVINYTNKAEAKRAELANATATAEAKRVEVVNATNTGNNTKTALDKATATAEAKRVEVVNATNTADTKKKLLDTAIQNASLENYMGKAPVRLAPATDLNTVYNTGFYVCDYSNVANTPETYGRLLVMGWDREKERWVTQIFFSNISNAIYTRATRLVTGEWGAWSKLYSDKYKPTPADVGTYSKEIIDIRTKILDTRQDNQNPSWYIQNYPQQTITEFKYANVIQIPNGITLYGTLETRVPWVNESGGYPTQVFRSNSFPNYQRHGISDTEWSPWEKVYTTVDKPTPAEIGALSNSGDVIHGNLALDAGKVLITANNYGIQGMLANGSASDYMLYMGADNRIKLSYNNRPVDVQTQDFKVNGQQVTTVADFNRYPDSTGYQKLPNGLIIQWGKITKSIKGGEDGQYYLDVVFPVVFPHTCLCTVGTPLANKYDVGKIKWFCQTDEFNYYTNNNKYATFRVGVETGGGATTMTMNWIAVGY